MSMSASLPGFLRRSVKAKEKIDETTHNQSNPNSRSQWVDSVLQSIKTAAAAAAVPSATQNFPLMNRNNLTSPVVRSIAVPSVSVSNQTLEPNRAAIMAVNSQHIANPYINDDVSEISDSPQFRTSHKIPIPSFSHIYQEMTNTSQGPAQPQMVKILRKKSLLRPTAMYISQAEQIYENKNEVPERVARYMQPLKRKVTVNNNTVSLKEEGKSLAIRSPPPFKGDAAGRAGIVLQPRQVEPTSRLHSVDSATKGGFSQQYIVTDSSSLSQKKDWIPNTIGNKVWSSRKVTRSASPNRSSHPHYAQPLARSHSQDHNQYSSSATTPPSHAKMHYASPTQPPPPPPPTSDLKTVPENMDYVKGLQAAFLSALREMLLAIPQHRASAQEEQKPVQLHLCQFCSQKMHHCTQCSSGGGGGGSNTHRNESPIIKSGQFKGATGRSSVGYKLTNEIDGEQISNAGNYIGHQGDDEMISNPKEKLSQYIPESTRLLESPAMRTLHSESATYSPERNVVRPVDSFPGSNRLSQNVSSYSQDMKQKTSSERLREGVSPESDSDFQNEISAIDTNEQRGRRRSIQLPAKVHHLSSKTERDMSVNKRKANALKVFEAPRRLASFSSGVIAKKLLGDKVPVTSNNGMMSSDESLAPSKNVTQSEGSRRRSLLKSSGDGRGKQPNEASQTSAEKKKKLLGMGKDSFAEFMDKKNNTNFNVEEEIKKSNMPEMETNMSSMNAGIVLSQRKPILQVNEPAPVVTTTVSSPVDGNLSRQRDQRSNKDRHPLDRVAVANDGSKVSTTSGQGDEFFVLSHQSASSSGEVGMTDVAELQRLNGWLSSIGMSSYSNLLLANGISKISIVELLREGDLANMGIQEDHINHILEKIGELSSRTRSFSEQALYAKQHRNNYASDGQNLKILTGRDASAIRNGDAMAKSSNVDENTTRLKLLQASQQQSPGGYSARYSDAMASEMNSPFINTARTSPTDTIPKGPTSPDHFPQSSHPIIFSILNAIDHGVYKDFLTCWCSAAGRMPIHSSQLELGRPALFDARLAIEFHLHVYFAIFPIMNRLDECKIYEGKLLLIRYLQYLGWHSDGNGSLLGNLISLSTSSKSSASASIIDSADTVILVRPSKPTAFMRSREFATYASLAIVPDPERNLALQDLFKPEWRRALRKSLGEFLHVAGVDQDASFPVIDKESDTATDLVNVVPHEESCLPMAHSSSPESLISRITNNKLKDCGEDCVSKMESFSASVDIIIDDGRNNNSFIQSGSCISDVVNTSTVSTTNKAVPHPVVKSVLSTKKDPSSPLAIYLEKVGTTAANSAGSTTSSLERRKIGSLSPKVNALGAESPRSQPFVAASGGISITDSVGSTKNGSVGGSTGSVGGFKLKKRATSKRKESSNTQESSSSNFVASVNNGNEVVDNLMSIQNEAAAIRKVDNVCTSSNIPAQPLPDNCVVPPSDLPTLNMASQIHADGHSNSVMNQNTSEINDTHAAVESLPLLGKGMQSENPSKITHKESDDHSLISQLTDDMDAVVDNFTSNGITTTTAGNNTDKAFKPLVDIPTRQNADTTGPTKIYQRLLDNNWSGIVKAPGLPKKSGDSNSTKVADALQPSSMPENTAAEAAKRKPKAVISKSKMQLQVSNYNKLLKQNGITLPTKEERAEPEPQPPLFPVSEEGTRQLSMQEQLNQQLQSFSANHAVSMQEQQQHHLPPRPPTSKTFSSLPSQQKNHHPNKGLDRNSHAKHPPADNGSITSSVDQSVSSSSNHPNHARNSESLRANSLELSPDDTLLNISSNTSNHNHSTRGKSTVGRDYKSDSEAVPDRIFDSKLSPIHPRNDYHSDTEMRGPPVSIADWKSFLQSSNPNPVSVPTTVPPTSSFVVHNNKELDNLADRNRKGTSAVLPSTNHSKMVGAMSDLPGNGYSLPSNRFDKKIALVPPNTTDDDFAVKLPSKSFNKKLPSSQNSNRTPSTSDAKPQQQLMQHYMADRGKEHGSEWNDAYLPSFSSEIDKLK